MSSAYLTIAGINLAILIGAAVVVSRRVSFRDFSPASAALLAVATIFVARPLALALWPFAARGRLPDMEFADQVPGVIYFGLGMAVWVAMVLLVLNRERGRAPRPSAFSRWHLDFLTLVLRVVSIAIWGALILYYIAAEGKLGSATAFFHRADAPGLIVTPVMVLLGLASALVAFQTAVAHRSPWRLVLVQLLLMIGSLGLGGRGAAFSVFLLPMMVYVAARFGGVRWSWLGATVLVALMAAGYIWVLRRGDTPDLRRLSIIGIGLSLSTGVGYDYYNSIIEVCTRNPEMHRAGQTYAFLLLRPFLGFERLTTDTTAPGPGVLALAGEHVAGGVPASIFGEGFWNFGLLGLLLAAMVYGLFVGECEVLTRSGRLPLAPIWQIYMTITSLHGFKSWFQQFLSNQIPFWTLLILVTVLVARRYVMAPRPVTAPAGPADDQASGEACAESA